MSVAAERFLATSAEELGDLRFRTAFKLRPTAGAVREGEGGPAKLGDGDGWILTTRAGEVKVVTLQASSATLGTEVLTAVFLDDADDDQLPAWALMDAVSGLPNRAAFERRKAAWAGVSGAVALGDCDGLKSINDLRGHAEGDRLLAEVGEQLRKVLQAELGGTGAFACRYGGDEFAVVLEAYPGADLQAARRRLASVLSAGEPGGPLSLVSWGTASFGPGTLEEGLRNADTDLYAKKGVLLQAASGGRVILSARRSATLNRTGGRAPYAAGIGRAFDSYSRLHMRHAAQEAADFVEWVRPQAGIAVIELGAGAGRITFDGGLARRIGPEGALLVTDPSHVQLDHARDRAQRDGLEWVRFAEAPAEELPVGPGSVDLVIGMGFLHLCVPPKPVLREAARVLRPGGLVAMGTWLEFQWPHCWLEILAPIHDALMAGGLPIRPLIDIRPGDLGRMCESAGLKPQRSRSAGPSVIEFATAEVSLAFIRQSGFLALLARDLGPAVRDSVILACERRLTEVFASCPPSERSIYAMREEVVAAKPA